MGDMPTHDKLLNDIHLLRLEICTAKLGDLFSVYSTGQDDYVSLAW